jgi:hypothetical protein
VISLTDELRDTARRIAEAAPALTPDQRARLRGLLAGSNCAEVTTK